MVPPATGGRLFADLRDIREDIGQRTYALLPATEWVVMAFLAEADDRWWAGVYWLYDDDGKALGRLTMSRTKDPTHTCCARNATAALLGQWPEGGEQCRRNQRSSSWQPSPRRRRAGHLREP